jgi:5'-nucleotidase
LVEKKLFDGVKYLDPIEITNDITNKLKNEFKCDLIICLSHLGFSYNKKDIISDLILAKKTKNIDLIIGGHTHTFMNKPVKIKNLSGKNVIINQVGCFGINIGKIDFYLTEKKIVEKSSSIKV